ncbi:tyrosine-type recombinase/integrase [Candidatus Uabimicrobium sp. HlEnr_7]|uniref:tyrosine-type recombinase/integrase n=1 Tax=Candidatus Uabimicrobium helgolandensis TaxID=3095367 RepID=UPI003555CD3E
MVIPKWKPPKISPKPLRHNNGWKIHFSYSGQQKKKYVGNNERTAYILQSRLNNLIAEFKCGLVSVPPHNSLSNFIFSKVLQKPDAEKVMSYETISRLSHLMNKYEEQTTALEEKAPKTIATEKIHFNHLRKFLKEKNCDPYLVEISISFFNDYKIHRKKQRVLNNTINKELRTFQTLFEFGVKHEYIEKNIVRNVKRGQIEIPTDRFKSHTEVIKLIKTGQYTDNLKSVKRYRYLTPQEMDQLIGLAKKHYSENHWLIPVLITFCHTGIRQCELLRLQWIDVDFEQNILVAKSRKQSKSKVTQGRIIEMTKRLRGTLWQQKLRSQETWVFSGPKGGQLSEYTLRSSFLRVIKNSDFEGIGFHCFRHSLMTNFALAGVDSWVSSRILGHTTEEMRQHYTHLSSGKRKDAIDRVWGEV